MGSALRAELAECEIVGRELPIAYVDGSGAPVAWRDRPRLQKCKTACGIADYKTDRDEAKTSTYAVQLGHYAEALTMAWSLESRPRCEVIYLRSGTRIEL